MRQQFAPACIVPVDHNRTVVQARHASQLHRKSGNVMQGCNTGSSRSNMQWAMWYHYVTRNLAVPSHRLPVLSVLILQGVGTPEVYLFLTRSTEVLSHAALLVCIDFWHLQLSAFARSHSVAFLGAGALASFVFGIQKGKGVSSTVDMS